MKSRWLFISWVVSSLLLCSSPLYSGLSFKGHEELGPFRTSFDEHFQSYGERFLKPYDWHWLKAQGYQESLYNQDAVSPAGAMGVMQIMPATWEDMMDQLGIIASPFNPQVNILVGSLYMRKMIRFWKAPRTDQERLELAQASYNAGPGNILRAQMKCDDKASWQDVSPCLSQVTGKHAKETLTYVQRIKRWYSELVR